jgi:hypothetical protein
MRFLHWLGGLSVVAGLGILGYSNPQLGAVLLFGGVALWLATQRGAPAVIRRYFGNKPFGGKSRKQEAKEQFARLNRAEHEALRLILLHGSILPNKVSDHLHEQGFADPERAVDNIRGKTSFLLGSVSGDFSVNPSMKDLLEELIEEPLLAHPAVGYAGVAAMVVVSIVIGFAIYGKVLAPKSKAQQQPSVQPPEVSVSPPMKATEQTPVPQEKDDTPKVTPIPKAKFPKQPSISKAGVGDPLLPKPPTQSQECAPGALCAQSTGQTGGITAGQVNFGPPPVTFSWKADNVTSTDQKFPYETTVTVTPTDAYSPVSLGFFCDAEVKALRFDMGNSGMALLNAQSGVATDNPKAGYVAFEGMSITPARPLYVHLWSSEPLKVIQVTKVNLRPPPPPS